MKSEIDIKYKELLANFNDDKKLKKSMKFFDRKQIMNYIAKQLLKNFNLPKISKADREMLKASRFPITYHRLMNGSKAEINKSIVWIKEKYQIKDIEIPNFEQLELEQMKLKLSTEDINNFFSCHDDYCLIVLAYSQLFKDLAAYQAITTFYYYLIMYINLECSFNKFIINENYEPFLIKLNVQLELIKVLSEIDPVNYNKLIRKLNKWFTNKALYRVIKESNKTKRGEK